MIKLGDKVKDKITKLNGTVVARAEYLYGCVWVCVVPKELIEGKPMDDIWLDEGRVELINKKEKDIFDKPKSGFRGGPMKSYPHRSVPKPTRG